MNKYLKNFLTAVMVSGIIGVYLIFSRTLPNLVNRSAEVVIYLILSCIVLVILLRKNGLYVYPITITTIMMILLLVARTGVLGYPHFTPPLEFCQQGALLNVTVKEDIQVVEIKHSGNLSIDGIQILEDDHIEQIHKILNPNQTILHELESSNNWKHIRVWPLYKVWDNDNYYVSCMGLRFSTEVYRAK